MAKLAWTPWHQVVKLRDDVRTGEISLATFAADLYFVMMGEAKPVYQDPKEFFALTYPTYNLRELSKEVVLRLAGKKEKAVRQLALPYGGGKTHSHSAFAAAWEDITVGHYQTSNRRRVTCALAWAHDQVGSLAVRFRRGGRDHASSS